jgi:hypothetical protein
MELRSEHMPALAATLEASGITAMFIVGGLFAVLWIVGLRVGRRGEELHAERWADVDSPAPDDNATPR